MAASRHTAEGSASEGRDRIGLKRRGILAAAGAAVAGLLAVERHMTPVAANTNDTLLIGQTPDATHLNNFAQAPTAILYNAAATVTNTNLFTVSDTDAGSASPAAVAGYASSKVGTGVYGYTNAVGKEAVLGKLGPGATASVAIRGDASSNNPTNSIGVRGLGTYSGVSGIGDVQGVFGQLLAPSTAAFTSGVIGYNYGTGGNTTSGVRGVANSGNGVSGQTLGSGVVAGVYGTSTTAYGVIGSTTAAGYSGLTAVTATPGVAALAATSTNASAFAAYFTGLTYVQGDFAVTGNKSAAVPHPDGTHRLLYCVESPESWFEDFGTAHLAGGQATVTLDPEFAAIVHADDYLVFLTPEGDSKGLYVTGKSARGFTVREQQGGASSLSFAWRVVAKRKDIEGKRLAKVDLPKINTPDPAKLPTFPAEPGPPKRP